MINCHEVKPFLVYITVSHSRRCKFYNSYLTYIVNSTSPVTKFMDNFLKNFLERMEAFQADTLVFFTTS